MPLRRRTTSLLCTAVLAAVVSSTPAAAQIGGAYNTLIFGNANVLNSDMEGRLAVGGSLTASNYSFGLMIPPAWQAITPTVRVAGNASITNGSIYGSMEYGGTASVSGVSGTISNVAPPPDFFTYLQTQSQALSTAYAGMAVSSGAGVTNTLVGGTRSLSTASAGTFVFQLFASGFATTAQLNINAPVGATVIVNVLGSSVAFTDKAFNLSGGVTSSNILFNFVDATSLTMSGLGFNGSVLAAGAAFTFNNGYVNGDVVAQSLSGSGQFNFQSFAGALPVTQTPPVTSVPEPATVALLAGGLAMIGLAARKRRA